MAETEIGKITHYYGHVSVGVIELTGALKVGDSIHVKGAHDDFQQAVDSIQLDHLPVPEGRPGQSVGIRVARKVHPHDKVFRVE
jgi:putative protease